MTRIATLLLSLLVLLPAKFAFAQAADTPFQVTVVTNDLTRGDTVLSLTNSGATATTVTNGALCINLYATTGNGAAAPAVAACCTCKVQPNGYASLSVNNELLAGVSPRPRNVVIKAMASTGTAGVCNASTVATGGNVLATGMEVWQGTPTSVVAGGNPYATPAVTAGTLSPFTASTLSASELNKLSTGCVALPARTCAAVCAQ